MLYQNEKVTKASVDNANASSCGGGRTVTTSTCTSAWIHHQHNNNNENNKAIIYMILLAIQFGIQPIVTRRYTISTINKSTVLLVQEIIKFIMAYIMLLLSGNTSRAIEGWNVHTWLNVALLPAGLYAIQNMASLTAYQNLDPFTYNTLNQTKTLSAALCCYIIMQRKQSYKQIVALFLLLLSALIMEGVVSMDNMLQLLLSTTSGGVPSSLNHSKKSDLDGRRFTHGVIPILLASFISGLAGALSQKRMQQTAFNSRSASSTGGRDAYLFTMELCAATCIILLISLIISTDGEQIIQNGFWNGWTTYTFIPIISNSAGGLIVGLVTKYAGSVRKGFALIFGIFLSGILQAIMQSDKQITSEQLLGGIIAAISLYLHAANPPTKTMHVKTTKQE